MKIVVTGGAGFIGSNLVDRLVEDYEVIVIDNLSTGKKENVNPKAKFIQMDILDITDLIGKIDCIFHLAAMPRIPLSVREPYLTHNINVNGTLKVLEYARKNNAKVVFASSSSVYGNQPSPLKEDTTINPVSPYAYQKAIGEMYMRMYNDFYGISTVSLRFFNVYGDRCDGSSEDSLLIAKFKKLKDQGKSLTIYGDGNQTRDLVNISDVVDALTKAMFNDVENEVINICSGKSISVNEIADIMGGEKEYLPPRKGDVLNTLGDNNKAKKILGWSPSIEIKDYLKI